MTVVDVTGFFHQFLVHLAYRDRFTLVSYRGLERSNVVLIGFKNTLAYVQRFMDRLLADFLFCRAFIDDIVIFSESTENHERHLRSVFGLFVKRNIALSLKKSFIGYPLVDLLRFRIDGLRIALTD